MMIAKLIPIAIALLTACAPAMQPSLPPPTPLLLTVTPSPGFMPTLTLTPAPIVTVQPTPTPGGFRLPTVRPIPVGSVDVAAWICHEENYWWDVYSYGMTLHEDPVGERLCLGLKTL